MTERLEGVRLDDVTSRGGRGLSREAMSALAARGQVAYREIVTAGGSVSDRRGDARRRTRLQSAKVLDAANKFICEALIQDRSPAGLRLLLARNVGLPARMGIYDDATGDVVTAVAAWRRGQKVGVRVVLKGPVTPLKASQRLALGGHYYAMRD